VTVRYRITEALPKVRFVIGIVGAMGMLFSANMLVDGEAISGQLGQGSVTCRLKAVPLMPGTFKVFGEVWGADGFDPIVRWSEWARFRITDVSPDIMHVSDNHSVFHVRADAPIGVPYDWKFTTVH
jgi:hypothetical protein